MRPIVVPKNTRKFSGSTTSSSGRSKTPTLLSNEQALEAMGLIALSPRITSPPGVIASSTSLYRLLSPILTPNEKMAGYPDRHTRCLQMGYILAMCRRFSRHPRFLDLSLLHSNLGGENQDESIQNALRALAYVSNDVTEALKTFNLTESSFFQGICYVFQDDKPFQLCKAALFLLSLICDRWFNTPNPILEPQSNEGTV